MQEAALTSRRKAYFRINSEIAAMSDAGVRALLDAADSTPGWGKHQTLEIAGAKVFVKSVPVTRLEHANAFSTQNLYDLPLHYNYGVGSAGFGAFRELLTHVKTTNCVLDGAAPAFPMLYGFRLLPFSGERTVIEDSRRNGYVTYWGGSEAVGRYFDERLIATHELVLLLEYFPHALHPWLVEHPEGCGRALEDLRDAVSFLRGQGIVHFDAHFFNVVTDGERAYLTDFGLALDRGFELADEEQQFLADHEYYDYGEVLWSLGQVLVNMYHALPPERRGAAMEACGLAGDTPPLEVMGALVGNIEPLAEVTSLERSFAAAVLRYRDVILLMQEFYASMHTNNRKDTPLDTAKLRRLLEECGFVD
jgi:hypothetical protein